MKSSTSATIFAALFLLATPTKSVFGGCTDNYRGPISGMASVDMYYRNAPTEEGTRMFLVYNHNPYDVEVTLNTGDKVSIFKYNCAPAGSTRDETNLKIVSVQKE